MSAPAVGEYLPAQRLALSAHFLGINCHHDALRPETVGGFLHELRTMDRRGIDRDLVGAGVEEVADVLQLADAAAHGQRDEPLAGHALHGGERGIAALVARGDIEEGDLVGTLLVVALGDLHRVAGIADVHEAHALDHAPVVDVETRNDALGQPHAQPPAAFASHQACAARRSSVPSYNARPLIAPTMPLAASRDSVAR